MWESGLPKLSKSVICYEPATSEPVVLTRTCQQAFSIPLAIEDKRRKIEKVNRPPYDCIGLVLTFYKNSDIPFYGTGFLISHNKVLTAAHNTYQKIYLNSPVADKVYFIPGVNGLVKNEEAIPVSTFDFCPEFASK